MARTKRPPGFEPPNVDGWIRLRPGEQVAWVEDTEIKPSRALLHESMRRIRGWVLGVGFEIEEAMVTTIAASEFGSLDAGIAGEGLLPRLNELRDEEQLARKIETVKPVLRAALDVEVADRLIQDLAEYRRLRHLMAHRPSWLEGTWDPDAGSLPDVPKGRTTGFRLFVADKQFVWEIDQAQGEEWSRLLDRCHRGLEAARATLLPPSAAPAPPELA